ncbi:MAG TPA: aminoglycoside phosphotransferase family protein [Caldilineaceae bacterium]|nr:aminoglycoside phosphotransferase family protein [Caldilineaceae bacterium]
MYEPPNLAGETIAGALFAHYAISADALTFLPLGNDSATAVYRVRASGGTEYFLKLRAGASFSAPSLLIPRYLQDQGLPHILAPLPTVAQALWVVVDDFALTLYPYIDGRIGAEVGLTEQQWRAFGALMRQVHAVRLPPALAQIVPRERFIPSRRNVIDELEAAIARQAFANAAERELAAFWQARRDVIRQVVDRADRLGERLRQAAAPLALCHADMHPWNVLLEADPTGEQWWLVDWDETILALKERDLMFVVGSIGRDLVKPQETACFMQGYGDGEGATPIDLDALTYYRYAWAVQDIAAYGEEVFFLPDRSEDSRRKALQGLMSLFEPGNIVDLALSSARSAA